MKWEKQLCNRTQWTYARSGKDKVRVHVLTIPIMYTFLHFQWKFCHNRPQNLNSIPNIPSFHPSPNAGESFPLGDAARDPSSADRPPPCKSLHILRRTLRRNVQNQIQRKSLLLSVFIRFLSVFICFYLFLSVSICFNLFQTSKRTYSANKSMWDFMKTLQFYFKVFSSSQFIWTAIIDISISMLNVYVTSICSFSVWICKSFLLQFSLWKGFHSWMKISIADAIPDIKTTVIA